MDGVEESKNASIEEIDAGPPAIELRSSSAQASTQSICQGHELVAPPLIPPQEDSQKRVELFVATPAYGGMVNVSYFLSMIRATQLLANVGVGVHLNTLVSESLVTRARNHQVSVFLSDPKYTHLLFIDSDIEFLGEAIVDLIKSELPVVGCAYPKKEYDFEKVAKACEVASASGVKLTADQLRVAGMSFVYNFDEATIGDGSLHVYKDQFIKVRDTGTGFMMIRREVIEAMVKMYPELKCSYRPSPYAAFNDTSYALFETMIEPGTRYHLSEDYAFCRRWQAMGGEVFVSTKWNLSHTGPHTFVGDIASQFTKNT